MASKLPRVVPIRVRSGLVHDLGTQFGIRASFLAIQFHSSAASATVLDAPSRYDCQPTPSQGGSCSCKVPWYRLGVLIQMSLGAMIASKSELRSESVEDKLSLRYDMMRS
ncbi:hypothetical protein TIFTF001_048918 [Ficus carica]|uniref:Uncharacterized protein n=1 Tax=Ficus carica TaxID=3494 RepID=A0AA88CY35_FICCA|nr:hypothetical protein TIFTF001_048918 [Ficus carica]